MAKKPTNEKPKANEKIETLETIEASKAAETTEAGVVNVPNDTGNSADSIQSLQSLQSPQSTRSTPTRETNAASPKRPVSIAEITSCLRSNVLGSTLAVLQTVGSTNLYIKQRSEILDDGFTVVSETQSGGRGRLGRSFLSPDGGLYMSTLLIDRRYGADSVSLTVKAAVAVARAIRELSGLDVGIKWVNDIYYREKKLCGILAERVVRKGYSDFTVLGIGVNVFSGKNAFTGELSEIAGSLSDFCDVTFSKSELAAAILNRLDEILSNGDRTHTAEIAEEYRSLSVIIGRTVDVIRNDTVRRAKVLGIDDDAALYVEYQDGGTDILRTGEVSTRLTREEETTE